MSRAPLSPTRPAAAVAFRLRWTRRRRAARHGSPLSRGLCPRLQSALEPLLAVELIAIILIGWPLRVNLQRLRLEFCAFGRGQPSPHDIADNQPALDAATGVAR